MHVTSNTYNDPTYYAVFQSEWQTLRFNVITNSKSNTKVGHSGDQSVLHPIARYATTTTLCMMH